MGLRAHFLNFKILPKQHLELILGILHATRAGVGNVYTRDLKLELPTVQRVT